MLPDRTVVVVVVVVGRGGRREGIHGGCSEFLWSLSDRNGAAEVRQWWLPLSQVRLKAHLPNPEGLLLLLSLMPH